MKHLLISLICTSLFSFAGNETNVAPTVTSLSLSSSTTALNKDETTNLSLQATYSNNTSKTLTNNIEWIVNPSDAVQITDHTLTAKKDTKVTLQAKVGNILSNTITLNITWVVDGHVLPPEPDLVVNNATLGGVDSNNNGVRDDVERKIYATYPVKLQRELMMDGAKYFQKIMTESTSKAGDLKKEGTKIGDCYIYLRRVDSEMHSDDFNRIGFLENYTVNTKERVRKYLDYNLALSGGVYGSSPSDWNKDACSEDVRKVLEEMGL